jgi:hypothetical protein
LVSFFVLLFFSSDDFLPRGLTYVHNYQSALE